MRMTREESNSWAPEIQGWSVDILPWYLERARELPDGAKIVEVGSYHGRSLIFLAEAFAILGKNQVKIWAVDPWAWKPGDWPAILHNLSQHARPSALRLIHLVRADSVSASGMFDDGELTMAFLDGEHRDPHPRQDIEQWLPKVKQGGLLAGHDYGDETWPDVKTAVDAAIPAAELVVEETVWSWRVR